MSDSWDAVRDWDVPPQAPPPPAGSMRQQAVAGCVDPGCVDPLCLPRRTGGGPRADDLGQHQAKMQEELLGLAKDNDGAAIRALIKDEGLNASYGNSIGQTALHIAAIWDACDAGRALLEAGADVNAQNDLGGATPLHMAALRGRRSFCELLLDSGADSTLAEDSGRRALDMCGPAHNQLREFLQDDLEALRGLVRDAQS